MYTRMYTIEGALFQEYCMAALHEKGRAGTLRDWVGLKKCVINAVEDDTCRKAVVAKLIEDFKLLNR